MQFVCLGKQAGTSLPSDLPELVGLAIGVFGAWCCSLYDSSPHKLFEQATLGLFCFLFGHTASLDCKVCPSRGWSCFVLCDRKRRDIPLISPMFSAWDSSQEDTNTNVSSRYIFFSERKTAGASQRTIVKSDVRQRNSWMWTSASVEDLTTPRAVRISDMFVALIIIVCFFRWYSTTSHQGMLHCRRCTFNSLTSEQVSASMSVLL